MLSGEPLRASDRDPEGCALLRPGEPPQVHVRRSGPHQAGPAGQVSTLRHFIHCKTKVIEGLEAYANASRLRKLLNLKNGAVVIS